MAHRIRLALQAGSLFNKAAGRVEVDETFIGQKARNMHKNVKGRKITGTGGKDKTAVNGRWVKAPGQALFEAVQKSLSDLPIVAETLGVITPEVEALRDGFGFPGMGILQFAFGKDPQAPEFKPHNYRRHYVVYTGTHDNDTTLGWWNSSGAGDSTRTAEDVREEKEFALKYLATDGQEMNWAFIRALLASVANLAIFPLQDVLGLGSEARMNIPATASGNWRWRFESEQLTDAICERLRQITVIYNRHGDLTTRKRS